ncbi:hypothetical protein D3C87_66580 [compost metagenome]
MKLVFVFAALLLAFTSCKKEESKKTPSTVIRYTIQPIDDEIIDVRYLNRNGDLIIEPDSVQFADGSYQFSVSSLPFTAKVGLRFYDNVNTIDEYEVSIYVNGNLKARDTVSNTTFGSIGEEYVEYLVQ